MRRTLESELKKWKSSPHRYPLLLRGARQVGKTYLIEQFGKDFESFEIVNFEAQPEAAACFETVKPIEIIQKLELLTKRPIRPGKTLLFLDEIQICPNAIIALRYFKETMPDLHVIGAGSLLEFSLVEGRFSFPVGRVQFIYLHPVSFQEFLAASGDEKLLSILENCTPEDPPPPAVHSDLIRRAKEYFIIGGMPAVVSQFMTTRSLLEQSRIQDLLLATYRADFGKYATEAEQKYLRILFDGIPYQVGGQFKYATIDPHIKSRELKAALEQLRMAGLVYPILSTSASGIPLAAQIKPNKFKPLFLDIGLVQRTLQVDPEQMLSNPLSQIHRGALAEQFVGQELIAYGDCYRQDSLYFWEREKHSSSAEVDYVITVGQSIVPVEVKAGAQGHLKSLNQFMIEKKSKIGIRISEQPLLLKDQILSIPFYLIAQIPRLVRHTEARGLIGNSIH
ncbi:MAG: ATP-binding protein [Verrucomicrobia bacterium]|nr:ATP-binding protein [Verrucomicrobiota bacterium]